MDYKQGEMTMCWHRIVGLGRVVDCCSRGRRGGGREETACSCSWVSLRAKGEGRGRAWTAAVVDRGTLHWLDVAFFALVTWTSYSRRRFPTQKVAQWSGVGLWWLSGKLSLEAKPISTH